MKNSITSHTRTLAITLLFWSLLGAALVYPLAAQNYRLDGTFGAGVSNSSSRVEVSALQTDGKIIVGGGFRTVNGVPAGSITRLNPDGSIDATFNVGGSGASSVVYDVEITSDGKILIGGFFSTYNGAPANRLARLNSDGTLDTSFNPGGSGVIGSGSSDYISSLVLQSDGKIIAAGSVAGYNGITNNSIFRLNADGTLDMSFASGFAGQEFPEHIAIQSDGKILLGGIFFSDYNSEPINPYLFRINPNGSLDTDFNTGGSGADNIITALVIRSDGKILIGGPFDEYNGASTGRRHIARINLDGTLDPSFDLESSIGGVPEYLALQTDGKILAAGSFDFSNGLALPFIRINSDGTPDAMLVPTADGSGVHVNMLPDGKILVTGQFNDFSGGQTHNGIARFDPVGSIDPSFNTSLTGNGLVRAIFQQADGKTVVGGQFRTANGNFSKSIARFNVDGTVDNTFIIGSGPRDNGSGFTSIFALSAQSDGKLLVGGNFGFWDGSSKSALVRLNADGSLDTSFTLSGDIQVESATIIQTILPLSDGKILIGGRFLRNESGQSRGLIRLDSTGAVDPTFAAGTPFTLANNTVNRVVPHSDGKFIIVGAFASYGGISRPRVARINADGSLDPSFMPGTGANSQVFDVAVQADGKIVIGGSFISYGGTAVNRITRLNSDGTRDPSFDVGSGANGSVNNIALQPDGKVLLGGLFTDVNGINRNSLVRLETNGNVDMGLQAGLDVISGVYALQRQSDSKLLVGGVFKNYLGTPRDSLLRLTPRSTQFDYDGDGRSDISVFRPSSGDWYLQRSADGFTGVNFGAVEDRIVPSDFDGDGKTDVAVYRPSTGVWYVSNSSDGTFSVYNFGVAEDLPVPADYDGDGKADICVFRPSTGTWYRVNSVNGEFVVVQFGANGDKPTIGDFDGDGKSDIAVFRPSEGAWYQTNSSDGTFFGEQFGVSTDRVTPADYDGDGKTDIAIYRPSEGLWYVKNSATSTYTPYIFGTAEDISVPGDFDGDGRADISVFRPSTGFWFIANSSNGEYTIQQFGQSGDIPTQSAFGN